MVARQAAKSQLPVKAPSSKKGSSTEGSRSEIPAEVWLHIFKFLHREKPASLSCPPRSEIRQGDLCRISRVCRLFEELCRPILYTTVVTDSFYGFLERCRFASMRRKYALTKFLYIEWLEDGGEPGYDYLLPTRGAWWLIGMSLADRQGGLLVEMEAQTKAMVNLFSLFLHLAKTPIFTSLETISVGSIYGKSTDGRWAEYERSLSGLKDVERQDPNICRHMFDDFRSRCPNLRHYCVRDEHSPLSMSHVTYASDPKFPANYSQPLHFDSTLSRLCLPLGRNVKWVSDMGQKENISNVLTNLGSCLSDLVSERKGDRKRASPSDLADVDLYFTTGVFNSPLAHAQGKIEPKFMTVEEQREEATNMRGGIQDILRGGTQRKDMVRWHASPDTPVCESCHTGPPA